MLEGKTALITGASKGIGRAIAVTYAQHGAFVGINYASHDAAAEETLTLVRKKQGDGMLLKGNVANPKEVDNIVTTLLSKRKDIDILVNNAGVYARHEFDEIDQTTWQQTIDANLTGCYNLCRVVIPHMKPGSKIIFMSSQLALRGSSHGADYATSKAGILGLMRSLSLELARKKICVNAVAPGTIDTDIIANYTEKMRIERAHEVPLGRLGTPEDVANVCLFLASALSNYVTGETINVNGGLYIQ